MEFPQSEQMKSQWNTLLPQTGSVFLRLLKQISPEEANKLFAELSKH